MHKTRFGIRKLWGDVMYKSCFRCGKIHHSAYKCKVGKPKFENKKYKLQEDKLRNKYSWALKAKEIKEGSNWLCAVCEADGIYNCADLEVHHITKLREDPDKLLDNDNLICLCRTHHRLADAGYIEAESLRKLAEIRENKL